VGKFDDHDWGLWKTTDTRRRAGVWSFLMATRTARADAAAVHDRPVHLAPAKDDTAPAAQWLERGHAAITNVLAQSGTATALAWPRRTRWR